MTDTSSSPGKDLNEHQQRKLTALLETIPSPQRGWPDAQCGGNSTSPDTCQLMPLTSPGSFPASWDQLDTDFADLPLSGRVAAVKAFAGNDPKTFDDLLFRIYAFYYQDDRVRRLIGSEPGPPFPRGNTIPAGDLSSLDRVVKRSAGYRPGAARLTLECFMICRPGESIERCQGAARVAFTSGPCRSRSWTGPSLTSETFMSAPNRPLATGTSSSAN